MYLHFYCPVLHGDVATLKIVRAFAALCVAILTIYVAMLLAMKSQQIANKVTTQLPTTKNGYQQWLFLLALLAVVWAMLLAVLARGVSLEGVQLLAKLSLIR